MLADQHIAFIGGGHISEIIIHRLTQGKAMPPENIIVSDPAETRREHLLKRFGVQIANDNTAAAQSGDLILICVRPEVVEEILPDLQNARLRSGQVIISVAAGIPLSTYHLLGKNQPLVRALPNPPSQVGQGISPLVFSRAVTPEQRQLVLALFSALGDWVEVEENHINAITSLSSPVATLLFFQSLVDAGVGCGLTHAVAEKVAAHTIPGSMAVWASRKVPLAELIQEASTPGGVSVETVQVLTEQGFKTLVMDAITRGAARSKELGEVSLKNR